MSDHKPTFRIRLHNPICVICVICGFLFCGSILAAPRPNVILMLADDLGWGDVGYHGSEIKTPNIDALAARGVQLDQFYVQPVCSPTRGALMTGRYPIRLGLQCGVVRPWADHSLPLDEQTLPEGLKSAGYTAAIVGKWHLGHSSTSPKTPPKKTTSPPNAPNSWPVSEANSKPSPPKPLPLTFPPTKLPKASKSPQSGANSSPHDSQRSPRKGGGGASGPGHRPPDDAHSRLPKEARTLSKI